MKHKRQQQKVWIDFETKTITYERKSNLVWYAIKFPFIVILLILAIPLMLIYAIYNALKVAWQSSYEYLKEEEFLLFLFFPLQLIYAFCTYKYVRKQTHE